MPKYLVWFGHNNSYFGHRFRELEALAHMNGVDVIDLYDGVQPNSLSADPYAIVHLPNDGVVESICQRSVLIKFVIELWGQGVTDDAVMAQVRETASPESWDRIFADSGFSYKVSSYGTQYTDLQRRGRMEAFSTLFTGKEKVDLKHPKIVLHVIDVFEHVCTPTGPRLSPDVFSLHSFYGRQVSLSLNTFRERFVLTARPILGPTSLDNDLAFLMANMAEIGPGDAVFDPFCGTGGLLLTASALTGLPPLGTDIDTRVLRGDLIAYVRNDVVEGKDIFQNFIHYGLPVPEVVAVDNSRAPWRQESCFDVILTDPPYGVRAGAKRIGARSVHTIGDRINYYPQMVGYKPEDVNKDLLDRSARMLHPGGRLVFLLHCELIDLFSTAELDQLRATEPLSAKSTKVCVQPSTGSEYVYAHECAREDQFLNESTIVARVVPSHSDLKLVSAVLQILSGGTGRILVVMRLNRL